MRNRIASTLLLGFSLLGAAASADDVFLKNGRKFEGVIAETTDTQVRIRMQGGVVSLPKSQVLRVESKDSDLSGYLRRKEALRRSPDARAQDWLELARWAKAQGLEQGAREAALAAAELDPKLDGLATLLRAYKYTFDEPLGRWISYEESMRKRGFVFTQGAWVSREELAERARLQREAEAQVAQMREAARADRAARQTEMLLATQAALLQETVRDRERERYVSPYAAYGWPVVVVPGYFPRPSCPHGDCNPPSGGGGEGPGPGSHHGGHTRSNFTRVPGSLIPGGDAGQSTFQSPDR
ncbi:MAG TPA: hypothetical protein VNM67_25685 [Thermoanaerobaculia bacterium]|jgi:hypothetical protein|nr:hypothetical protein [Thermoanaerobaculia bacterium]